MKLRLLSLIPLASLLLLGFTSCACFRPNVSSLVEEQQSYYAELQEVLQVRRSLLKLGLEEQLDADLQRQRDLLEWERDLAKAEILLSVDSNVALNMRLLMLQLAQAQLASLERVRALESIDRGRMDAILALYDTLIAATRALEHNSAVLSGYVGSGDTAFALRSLDTAALAEVLTSIRAATRKVEDADEEAFAELAAESARVEKNLERARGILVRALARE